MADKTTHLGMNLPLGTELTDQELYNENFVTLDTEVANRLTAVNGVKANENGNAILTEVPFAKQIVSDEQQQSSAEYTFRTTGGEASLEDGDATLVGIYGRSVHTGVASEVFTMTVTPASRTGGAEPITATINKATFIAYVSNPSSITVELLYTNMWSANPALYGITVTGTPVSGDAITVEYVRPDRGTITPSNPTQFVSTGWNLYNNAVGYARVKKYSDQYNFIIDGAYTSLKFSETYDGIRQNISVLANRFSVPSDGYVWVTGSNANSTCIYMTWSDWNRGYEGEWKAYEESVVDFSGYTDSVFPYGMCQVGPVADEIDFSLKRMIRRIDRTAYNASTIETLISNGTAYDADTNYIYYVLAEPVVTEFDVSNIYIANDHGLEMIDGETAPLILTLYGENLVEKLQHDIPDQIEEINSALRPTNAAWIHNTNLNNYTTTGQYMIGTDPVNAPRPWGTLSVVANKADTIYQTYVADGRFYYREFRNSVWGNWQEIATNDQVSKKFRSIEGNPSATIAINNYPSFAAIRDKDSQDGMLMIVTGMSNAITVAKWGTKSFNVSISNGSLTVGSGNILVMVIG